MINRRESWLSEQVIESARAARDRIESIIPDNFEGLLGDQFCKFYSSDFAKRAMTYLAFEDHNDYYHVIDFKIHRLETRIEHFQKIKDFWLARV